MDEGQHREFRDEIFGQFARIGKALASPKRLEILELLAQGERSVEEVASRTDASVAVASQHLRNLRGTGMLETRRDAQRIYYRLADESVYEALRAVRTVGERRLAKVARVVDQYLAGRDSMRAVCAGELVDLMKEDAAVVLDVRPEEEYRAGHIAGAQSVPVEKLEEYLCDLPEETKYREVVAYCRGAYCVFSDEAVRILNEKGYRVSRLAEGYPEWRAAGLPTER
jgi:rhodanese-related sulfurtransferase/DNA-binding transcriptional ArsR family regulator